MTLAPGALLVQDTTPIVRIRPRGAQAFSMTQQEIQQESVSLDSLLAPEGAKVSR